MKKLVAALLLLSPAAAFGADLANKPAAALRGPSYEEAQESFATGVYVGVNAGSGSGGFGRTTQEMLTRSGIALDQTKTKLFGAIGGAQVGFLLKSGSIVYGVEADISAAGMRGAMNTSGTLQTSVPGVYDTVKDRIESRLYALGTLRARLGYAFGDAILYGTGGIASARYEVTETTQSYGAGMTTPHDSYLMQVKQWTTGWALGFGGEYAVSRNVSLKVEYIHTQLNKKIDIEPWGHSLNFLRTGINYRF